MSTWVCRQNGQEKRTNNDNLSIYKCAWQTPKLNEVCSTFKRYIAVQKQRCVISSKC